MPSPAAPSSDASGAKGRSWIPLPPDSIVGDLARIISSLRFSWFWTRVPRTNGTHAIRPMSGAAQSTIHIDSAFMNETKPKPTHVAAWKPVPW